MANPESVELLKTSVDGWNEWRNRALNDTVFHEADPGRADLIKANLRLLDLRGAKLDGAILREAYLNAANLKNANLKKADLRAADLRKADLSAANLQGANLRSAVLTDAKMEDADLTDVDLTDADLNGVELCGAKLIDSNLSGVQLRGANLVRANLQGVNLRGVDLHGANLSAANLRSADLRAANLNGANVRQVDFTDVQAKETVFANLDLSTAVGLDSVSFLGPCPIDISTLSHCISLPSSFLRGCGLSDEFILYIPSLFGAEIEFFSCFICYSGSDERFARRLFDCLQRRGVRCWLDKHEIFPGDDILRSIDEALRIYDKVLLCCSEMSLREESGWWVQKEIDRTLRKELEYQRAKGKSLQALIPLDLDGFLFSNKCTHHCQTDLLARHVADFTGWETNTDEFQVQLEWVIKALRADEGARKPPPESKL